jgi:hypothetical protein
MTHAGVHDSPKSAVVILALGGYNVSSASPPTERGHRGDGRLDGEEPRPIVRAAPGGYPTKT